MKINSLKNKIIFRWFFSYAMVLLIPLLSFVAASIQYIKMLDDEVKYYNELSINLIQFRMDSFFGEVNKFAGETANHPGISSLLKAAGRDSLSPLMLSEVIRELNRLQINSDMVDAFLIYFPALDLVINGSTYNSSEGYFNTYLYDSKFVFGQWDEMISNAGHDVRLTDLSFKTPLSSKEYIVLVRPLSFALRNASSPKIIFFLNRNSFFPPPDSKSGIREIIIADRASGEPIYDSSGRASFGAGNISKDSTAVSVDSNAANLKYIIVSSRDAYLGKLEVIRGIFLVCFLFCIVAGFIFIVRKVKSNWSNFDAAARVINIPQRDMFVPPGKKQRLNEYQYFSNTISLLQAEQSEMKGKIRFQESFLKSRIILGMLDNSVETKSLSRADLEYYGIVFKSDIFLVMLVNDGRDCDAETMAYIGDRLGENNIASYGFNLKNHAGFIINPSGFTKENEHALFDFLLKTISDIRDILGAFNFSCSNIFSSYTVLNEAYIEAADVMEYNKRFAGKGDIIFYRDIAKLEKGRNFTYTGEQEFRISEELRNGNAQKVVESIEQAVKVNMENQVSPQMMRYLLFNIAGTIVKVYNSLDRRILDCLPELVMPPILVSDDFAETCGEVERAAVNICKSVRETRAVIEEHSGKEYVFYKMVEYFVNKNYSDVLLTVSLIAENLKTSLTNLSRIFKKFGGVNISDYINLVRIRHAKILLGTGRKLADIADSTGFGSLRTFMRVFKRYEGITPGQYKARLSLEEQNSDVCE